MTYRNWKRYRYVTSRYRTGSRRRNPPSEWHGEPLEQGEFKRGRGGRPTRGEAERRHRSLLRAATRLFLEKGWEGASIDEISRRSGVAKRFIYARYPDKTALFVAAVERFRDSCSSGVPRLRPAAGGLSMPGKPADVRTPAQLDDRALRPETLANVGACSSPRRPRFPGSAQAQLPSAAAGTVSTRS